MQNRTLEFLKRIESITKNENHSRGTTVLSLNDQAHANSHWRTTSFSNHCVWCPRGDKLRSTHSGKFLGPFCKVPLPLSYLHHLEDFLPLGREPHHEKPLTPTTKLFFKMGEKRYNSHHQKCPKTFDFKRTVHFLWHLKLMVAAITPASKAHSTAPSKTIPSRRAVQSTACMW